MQAGSLATVLCPDFYSVCEQQQVVLCPDVHTLLAKEHLYSVLNDHSLSLTPMMHSDYNLEFQSGKIVCDKNIEIMAQDASSH